MVASFVTAGVLNEELLFQNTRELLLFWIRMKPVVNDIRAAYKDPNAWKNLETVAEMLQPIHGPGSLRSLRRPRFLNAPGTRILRRGRGTRPRLHREETERSARDRKALHRFRARLSGGARPLLRRHHLQYRTHRRLLLCRPGQIKPTRATARQARNYKALN